MSLRAILDATKTILSGISVAGRVYEHQLYAMDDVDFVSFFKDSNNRIDTCMITRGSTDAQDEGPNNQFDYHLLVIDKYRSVSRTANDSINSEDAFQDDVETIRATFKGNRKLTVGGIHNAHFAGAMSAPEVHYVMFCGVLCHHAKLTMKVKDGPISTQSL
jgi:hypothetical protein